MVTRLGVDLTACRKRSDVAVKSTGDRFPCTLLCYTMVLVFLSLFLLSSKHWPVTELMQMITISVCYSSPFATYSVFPLALFKSASGELIFDKFAVSFHSHYDYNLIQSPSLFSIN